MKTAAFSQQFIFRQYSFHGAHYNDARQGNNCHFVAWMRRGTVRIVGGGTVLTVREGELFYIPKDFSYESFWTGSPDIEFDSYGFSYFPRPTDALYPVQTVALTPSVREALETLSSHCVADCRGIGCFYLLLDAMLPLMRTGASERSIRTLEMAMAYMQSRTELSVPAMARHCGVSESGLYAVFRKTLGLTPVEAFQHIRITHACELLESTELSVEEIAARLDFCSASYFRRVFGRVTGVSPRAWRNRAKL